MEKTYFIAFEGIDGCGKDTQLHKLACAIKEDDNYPFGNKYSNIWVTREPTKITPSGETIARLLRGKEISGEDATKYFVEDRIEHSKMIKDILKHSHVLISRYDLSTLSYQMVQGMKFEDLYKLHNYNKENGCIIPDITLVFDLPVKVASDRMNKRNSTIEFTEKFEFQKKVKDNLSFCIKELEKKDKRKIIIINANQSKDNVTKEMLEKISNYLKSKEK